MNAIAAPAAAPRKTGRRRLRWLLVFLFIFIGLPAGYYFYARWSLERELAEVIAETDRLDPRWRLEDIEADRKTYRDEENAALQVMKAVGLIGWNSPTGHRDYAKLFDALPQQAQLNSQQVEFIQKAFDNIPEGLAEARKLMDMPGGRFPIKYAPDWFLTSMEHQQNSRRVFGLLQSDAMLLAHHGDLDAALDSCMSILNAARATGDEPSAIRFLIRVAGDAILVWTVERCLAQGFPSDAAMKNLQTRLAQERTDLPIDFVSAFRGERAGHHQFFLVLRAGKFELSMANLMGKGKASLWDRVRDEFPIVYTKDYPQHLRHMNHLVEAARLRVEEQLEQFEAIQKGRDQRAVLSMLLAPNSSRLCSAHVRTHALLACTEVSLACERFRLMYERWPDTLPELVKVKLLDAVPTDPFDGQPMRLARRNDGLTVYSVGYDKEDNGGNIVSDRPFDKGADLGFRLWDSQQRRQPPRPAVALDK
jgi:hypothetical protein